MGAASAYTMAAGAILGTIEIIRAGNAAKRKQAALHQLAEIPGVDVGETTGEALTGREQNFQQASRVAGQQNTFDQSEVDRMLEMSIPGYKAMQASRTGNAAAFLEGDIPDDVRSQIYRRGASKAVGGGFGGSEAHGNLVARDLGLTSLDLIDRGQRYSSSIIGSTPHAPVSTTSRLSGVDPGDVLGLRERQRTQFIRDKQIALGVPGFDETTSKYGMQVAGSLMGNSLGSSGGAPSGGGGQPYKYQSTPSDDWA